MKLLQQVNATIARLTEDAAGGAVSAGSVAMNATPLFSMMVKRSTPTTPTTDSKKKKKKKGLGIQEAFDALGAAGPAADDSRSPSDPTADAEGVVAKLKSLENKEKTNYRDTVSFGLEDDNGGLVRVTVKAEQAEDFEKGLQTFMAKDEDEQMEIAEILFKMRDHFDIVDVQWPEVEEDEEEDVALAGGEQLPADGEGVPGEEGDMGDLGVPPPEDTEGQAMSALSQVIDMMKSEAEARKAEAKAKEAEAKAKEAEAIIAQATAKVKQEEQFLDMDTYNKAKKDEEREAKRLAQLARWKHEMSNEEGVTDDDEGAHMGNMGGGSQMPAPEEEERATFRRPAPMPSQPAPQPKLKPASVGGRVSTKDIANFILNRVK